MSYFKFYSRYQNKEDELSGLYGRKKEVENHIYGFCTEAWRKESAWKTQS